MSRKLGTTKKDKNRVDAMEEMMGSSLVKT